MLQDKNGKVITPGSRVRVVKALIEIGHNIRLGEIVIPQAIVTTDGEQLLACIVGESQLLEISYFSNCGRIVSPLEVEVVEDELDDLYV